MKKLIAMLVILGFAGTMAAQNPPQTTNPKNTPMDHGKDKDKGKHKGEKKHHHHHEHGKGKGKGNKK